MITFNHFSVGRKKRLFLRFLRLVLAVVVGRGGRGTCRIQGSGGGDIG